MPFDPPPWDHVIVDDAEQEVLVAGSLAPVRVLLSHNVFSFELKAKDRVVPAAGRLNLLDSIELVEFTALHELHASGERLVWPQEERP